MVEKSILKQNHFSQIMRFFCEEDKQDQVWFETIINKELVQKILSYGKDVEVLAPENLKNELKEHVDSLRKYYLKELRSHTAHINPKFVE